MLPTLWTVGTLCGMEVQGAQVVRRIGSVLRVVAAAAPDGCSTSHVAAAAELSRPTTHRLLTSPQSEGYLDRDNSTGQWFLGPEMYLMGAVAASRYDVTRYAQEFVETLAEDTGESAFFSARRQSETICLIRVDGSFPIRSFVLDVGVRFPLGVASAGLAILAHLPKPDVDEYLSRSDLTQRWGSTHQRAELHARIEQTRQRGYAVNPGLIVEGSFGMGAAVFSAVGRPEWALSITGIESRFSRDRQPELGRLLLKAAHGLSRRLRHPQ